MSEWIGKRLKSGYDTFIVKEVRAKPGANPELVCEVVNAPKRRWVVPLQDDGTLPGSVTEAGEEG